MLRAEEKSWALWCHLAAFSALLGVPFGSIFGPLLVWLLKRNESEFVDEHGKESLNFQLSLALYTLAAVLAMIVFFIGIINAASNRGGSGNPPAPLTAIFVGGGLVGPLLLLLLIFPLIDAVFTIIAAVKASNGEHYQYPFIIRFLR